MSLNSSAPPITKAGFPGKSCFCNYCYLGSLEFYLDASLFDGFLSEFLLEPNCLTSASSSSMSSSRMEFIMDYFLLSFNLTATFSPSSSTVVCYPTFSFFFLSFFSIFFIFFSFNFLINSSIRAVGVVIGNMWLFMVFNRSGSAASASMS